MMIRVAVLFVLLTSAQPAWAKVRVIEGPSPIPGASASAAGDLTLANDRFAVSFALQTQPPWGLPRGVPLDLAIMEGGRPGSDRVATLGFLPDSWSDWSSGFVGRRFLERSPQRVRLRITHRFRTAELVTDYTLTDGSPILHVRTRMTNGGETPLAGIRSGYSLNTLDGSIEGPWGRKPAPDKTLGRTAGDWLATGAESWTVGLWFPGADCWEGAIAWRDLYRKHDLAPGQTRDFQAWYLVEGAADADPIQRLRAMTTGSKPGRVVGSAGSNGTVIVVAERDEQVFSWTSASAGGYEMHLPAGEYRLSAWTTDGYTAPARTVRVTGDSTQRADFGELLAPARLKLSVTDNARRPLAARLDRRTTLPPLSFLGSTRHFTDAGGQATIPLPAGTQRLEVLHGGGFLASPSLLELRAEPGTEIERTVTIETLVDPRASGWYSADLHHHTDIKDGATSPADSVRSQVAAGLDLVFISDHDSVANHDPFAAAAVAAGAPVIRSVEISPSWGHFNVYPLPEEPGALCPADCRPEHIQALARRTGALVQANHSMEEHHAYLRSRDKGALPFPFVPFFDFLEINAGELFDGSDRAVLKEIHTLWSRRKRIFLTGGSDTHDVHADIPDATTGRVRTFALVDGELTAASFTSALKAGRSYVSFGPVLFPDPPFGATIPADREFTWKLTAYAIAGLCRIRLVADGEVVQEVDLGCKEHKATIEIRDSPAGRKWYSLEVEDAKGNIALSNPVFVSTQKLNQ